MWVKSDFSRFVDCSFKAGSGAVWFIESCLRGRGCTGHGSPEMKFTEEEGEEEQEEKGKGREGERERRMGERGGGKGGGGRGRERKRKRGGRKRRKDF